MLYTGERELPGSDDHEGFVAGRYRNSAHSDIWTDVRRCAEGTFSAYIPACECGWRGNPHPVTDGGYRGARQAWVDTHFAAVYRTVPPCTAMAEGHRHTFTPAEFLAP